MYNVYECAYYVHVGILLKWLCSNARLLPLTIMTNDAPRTSFRKSLIRRITKRKKKLGRHRDGAGF